MRLFLLSDERNCIGEAIGNVPVHIGKLHLLRFCLPLWALTLFQAHGRTELRTLIQPAAQNSRVRK